MDDELVKISQEIFKNVISQLTLHLRFMDIALDRFEFINDSFEFECDGRFFHYNPLVVIKKYSNNPKSLTRGYLHTILHSIFQHPYLCNNYQQSVWDLACDIAVENMIIEFNLDCISLDNDNELIREIKKIKDKTKILTAQKIYHYLLDETIVDQRKLLVAMFKFDDHTSWYHIRDVVSSSTDLFGDETHENASKATNNNFDKASHDSDETSDKAKGNDESDEFEIQQIKNTMKDWQDISQKIETDLETFNAEYGDSYESLVQSLKKLNQEKYNYSLFLRKFMTSGEKVMINDDEFDYIFYTYGLKLYKNLPLIEPLEYKETKSIKELVIAIDTSGSVQGDIVQAFLQKTYNLLNQREFFFNQYKVCIIQCDMKIQHVKMINNYLEFEDYINNIEIYGLGGTDFRPVFEYVNNQITNKEFNDLGGLIYFTDGDGAYPKKIPDYKTAFVFLEGNKDITVPPWAIKYILDEDEVKENINEYQRSKKAN